MRGKIVIWMMIGLLFLQPKVVVHAAPSENSAAEVVSGYCLGDELHAFIRIDDGYDMPTLKVSLQSGEVSANAGGTVAPITETDAIVRYLFMIDLSGTMRSHKEEVNLFVDSLMDTEEQEAFYTIATFGEQFQVVKENLTDKNAVKKTLSKLQYIERLTDPYTGVESALIYLDGCSKRSGDLIHLVVITDGDPALGIKDEEERLAAEQKLAQSLTERIQGAPEVIVSTICVDQWDENAYQALASGSGIHEMIDDDQDAKDAGVKMAEYVDGLYRIRFKLSRESSVERFAIELKIRGNMVDGQLAQLNLSLENVPNLKRFSQETQGGQGGQNQGGQESQDGQENQGGQENQDGQESQDGSESQDGQDNQESQESTSSGAEQDGDEAPPREKERESEDDKTFSTVLLILGGVLAIFGIVGLILLKKRSSARVKKQAGSNPVAGGGIAMRLEVYSGKCLSHTTMFYLSKPIVIGSAKGCDVIFKNAGVSPRNSRILLQDQMIYIEDLNSAKGTMLGGMRIQGRNRLRSGDVISIGNVEFTFKF